MNSKNIFRAERQSLMTILLAVLFLTAAVVFASPVYAGTSKFTYQHSYEENVIRVYRGETLVRTVYPNQYRIESMAAISGNKLYYVEGQDEAGYTLWKYSIKSGTKTCLCTLPSDYIIWGVQDVYGGCLYLEAGNPSDNSACYRYYVKKNKLEKISEAGFQGRFENYIICDPSGYYGDAGNFIPIYIYNAKTGKGKTLEAKSGGYSLVGGKVYYSACLDRSLSYIPYGESGVPKPLYYAVKVYDLKTGATKTLVKKLKATYTHAFSKKNIYLQKGGKYYRYSISKKKATKLSWTKYRSIIWG